MTDRKMQKKVSLMTKLPKSQTQTQWHRHSAAAIVLHTSSTEHTRALISLTHQQTHRPPALELTTGQLLSVSALRSGKNKELMHLESYLSAKQASEEKNRRWREQTEMKIMKVKLESETNLQHLLNKQN